MRQVDVRLSDSPDGFGFYYGTARMGDAVVQVNIVPPEHLWAGDMRLELSQPDATHWQVFADGERSRASRERRTWARPWGHCSRAGDRPQVDGGDSLRPHQEHGVRKGVLTDG